MCPPDQNAPFDLFRGTHDDEAGPSNWADQPVYSDSSDHDDYYEPYPHRRQQDVSASHSLASEAAPTSPQNPNSSSSTHQVIRDFGIPPKDPPSDMVEDASQVTPS
ncbi:hypothetical protein KC19_5G163700 [Ceratodon purpureus]|uniref:Uncharacterized protein n=1 Tax=Ceratodon purpureus TaxID=3225 RepID=A0A8T0I261_CERPU|nr:hypothetical protein KC19_5G163700 [Ceratodon purpureus]